MTIHNYYRIVDDVKKIIYNLELLMVMISSLHRVGVAKMSVLTLADKTTRMLVKMFKNFKCKYKHFISNVMDRYNRIMVMLYIRITCVYKIDERILKNCIYMIYNDYSKYYIYNDFTDHDKKLAESDAYVNGLFCKIIQVFSDFIKFIECKIAKYGHITRVGYEGYGHGHGKGRDVSSYSSHGLAEKHIDTKYGSKHKGKGSDTSSHDRYIKSSTDCRLTPDLHKKDKPCNKFESSSTKCENSSKIDIFNKVDKHNKKHTSNSDSSSDSFDPKKFKHKKRQHKQTSSSDNKICKSEEVSKNCKNKCSSKSSLPEIQCSSKESGQSFIVSDSHTHSAKSSFSSSSMSEFSFMEFDKKKSECAPEAMKEMNFLIEHGDANPNGEYCISTDYSESSDEVELDAIKQQKFLIENNIHNPNNSKKYKKVCDELTCNSSDIRISESEKNCKSKVHELTFDKTSEVCDYPISETILVCNDSPSSCHSDKKHKHGRKHNKKHKHNKHKDSSSDCEHKHTSSKKNKSHDPVFLSVSCNLVDGCSPKKKCDESVDTLMCNDSISFSDACDPRDKICEKYKHYIPQTKKILKSLHEMLKCSKLDEISKREMYNTVMRIKHNKQMYHIFKVVARQCDFDFNEMIKAVCKMSMVC